MLHTLQQLITVEGVVVKCDGLYDGESLRPAGPAECVMYNNAHLSVEGYDTLRSFLVSLATHNNDTRLHWSKGCKSKRVRKRKVLGAASGD